MRLLIIAVYWLLGLLAVLGVVVYWLHRTKRLKVDSQFTLSDVANFVSVLLAVFVLAFTLGPSH